MSQSIITNVQDGVEDARGYIMMAFQLAKIGTVTEPLSPYTLILKASPNSFSESMSKSKSVAVTKGGYVEFLWADELDSVSASGSTGAFIGPEFGLNNVHKNESIAYKKYKQLIKIYENNGQIFNNNGTPTIRTSVIMIYDRGIYNGHFKSFDVSEDSNVPYAFNLSWTFVIDNHRMYK